MDIQTQQNTNLADELGLTTVPDAVMVLAADFNGETWDGFPFDADPPWLRSALACGEIRAVTPGCTDYAE